MKTLSPLVALWLGLALTVNGCCHQRPVRDILLITVDTLRADHVGLYGYSRATTPEVDKIFAKGAIYLRAYSAEASTSPSVASILTGLLPQEHGVRLFFQLLDQAVPTIPDLLPDAYQTAAFVSNMVLTDEAIGLGNRFDHYDDYVDEKEPYRNVYERNATRTTEAVAKWLTTKCDPRRPLFLWVHYIDPHGPYHPPPTWKRTFRHPESRTIDILRVPDYQREPGVTDGFRYVDAYDEEIAYVDSEIGRLVNTFASVRSLDDTLLIFTADHGESMMEHERWFTHGYHVYDEIVRVPLLLAGPGVKRGRFDHVVSNKDIFKTVLKSVGVRIPARHDTDVDLRRQKGFEPPSTVYTEATEETGLLLQRRAVIQDKKKWIIEIDARDGFFRDKYFFDLRSDPRELSRQYWPEENEVADALLRLVEADPDVGGIPKEFREGIRLTAPKIRPGVDEKTLERLKALGYAQ